MSAVDRIAPDGAPTMTEPALCSYHQATVHGLRSAHMSEDGWLRRVRQIGGQCRACLDAEAARE